MRNSKQNLAIVLLPAFVSLVGCAGKIRYPSYYVLNVPVPISAAKRPAPILGSVALREFDAPGFLRGGPIAYRESPEKVGSYEYDRWAADPRRTLTEAMIHQMESLGVFQSVSPFDGRGNSECLVTGSIDHLEEVDQGSSVSIEVGLSARLINLGRVKYFGRGLRRRRRSGISTRSPGSFAEMSCEMGSAVESSVSSMQICLSVASLSISRSNTEQ
jgi:uncharacterized lipoprotein YmbA